MSNASTPLGAGYEIETGFRPQEGSGKGDREIYNKEEMVEARGGEAPPLVNPLHQWETFSSRNVHTPPQELPPPSSTAADRGVSQSQTTRVSRLQSTFVIRVVHAHPTTQR